MTSSYRMTRKATMQLLDAVNDGLLDADKVLENLLGWLPEAKVAEFVSDEYSELEPEDDDTDDDTDEEEDDDADTDTDEEA